MSPLAQPKRRQVVIRTVPAPAGHDFRSALDLLARSLGKTSVDAMLLATALAQAPAASASDMGFVDYHQTDKQEHFMCGGLVAAVTIGAVERVSPHASFAKRLFWGTAVGTAAGLFKEGADHFDGGDCSWRDAAATAEGALFGSLLTIAASDAADVAFKPTRGGISAAISGRF